MDSVNSLIDDEELQLSAVSSEGEVFQPFTRLPPEIRNMIWEAAVRNYKYPSVHLISDEWGRPHLDWFGDQPLLPRVENQYSCLENLRRSRFTPVEKEAWLQDNLSARFTDGGIWSVCREARSTIQSLHLDSLQRILGSDCWGHTPEEKDGLWTEYKRRYSSPGQKQPCQTISVHQDLLYLTSPRLLSMLMLDDYDYWLKDRCHIQLAIDYDPEWDRLNKLGDDEYMEAIGELSWLEPLMQMTDVENIGLLELHLVDHSMKLVTEKGKLFPKELFFGNGFLLVKNYGPAKRFEAQRFESLLMFVVEEKYQALPGMPPGEYESPFVADILGIIRD